ncbi:uncharacterized protein LOC142341734 [Convolutriloba macropyga]|uniref:uncharacterized protein LOC142341734 n=1 Tax=Convolutriloba macropyga TaxID=536237 RepID=UPI003F5253CD
MVISHLFQPNFSMDFDSFIPPIPPNFTTPGSPALAPPSSQILFPPVNPSAHNLPPPFGCPGIPPPCPKKESIPTPPLGAQQSQCGDVTSISASTSSSSSSLQSSSSSSASAALSSTAHLADSLNSNNSTINGGRSLDDLSNQSISNKSPFNQDLACDNSENINANSNSSSTHCISPPSIGGGGGEKAPKCIGCNQPILDQFILRVAPDLEWHASCLKCNQCATVLDERQTCYLKDGKPYCKLDYIRLFSIRCGKCDQPFEKTDRVMRTMNKVYHVDCFSCNVCFKQLLPGDEYAIREDLIFCREDMVELMAQSTENHPTDPQNRTCENPTPESRLSDGCSPKNPNMTKYGSMNNPSGVSPNSTLSLSTTHDLDRDDKIIFSPDDKSSSCKDSLRGEKHRSKDGSKPTRIRTVLNEKQLHTLRTCYNANPRPDALMREQLVEMTGLSPRVIRVWFQNKRCKDKKRSIAIKQMHQLQAEKNISGLNGVPMVAGSPMRHDPVLDGQFPPYPHPPPPFGLPPHHAPHPNEMDPTYMMAFDNGGGPGSVISDGCLGSPTGSDCSLSLSSD